jgi:hypothetical protein
VLAVPGLDGVIRSQVQHHREHVSYVFSGSEPSLLRDLFAERARPLYSQALPVRLGRIDPSIRAEPELEATWRALRTVPTAICPLVLQAVRAIMQRHPGGGTSDPQDQRY